jgi:hypothetical protein
MRDRVRHWLVLLLTLLAILNVALWMRSGWVAERIEYLTFEERGLNLVRHEYLFASGNGLCNVVHVSDEVPAYGPDHTGRAVAGWYYERGTGVWTPPPTVLGRLGFTALTFRHGTQAWTQMTVPYWCTTILLVLPSVVLIVRARREAIHRQRLALGLCVSCGYDLRASAQRCPECGAAIVSAAPSTDEAHSSPAPASETHPV